MEESQKRIVVIVVLVIAVLAAGFSAYRVMSADKLQEGVNHPYTGKSLKQMEMERQAKEDAAAKSGAPIQDIQERDLSGMPGGGKIGKD